MQTIADPSVWKTIFGLGLTLCGKTSWVNLSDGDVGGAASSVMGALHFPALSFIGEILVYLGQATVVTSLPF